jgi:hypothetical protein
MAQSFDRADASHQRAAVYASLEQDGKALADGREQAGGAAGGEGTVRHFFGLQGDGLQQGEGASGKAGNDGTLEGLFKTALEDSIAVTCLYVIVVCGRGITVPGATSVFLQTDFWIWLALLVACNVFLQVFYPSLKAQLVNASVLTVVLVLMSPIKTSRLVGVAP